MHFYQDSALELHTLYTLATLAGLQFAEAQTREALDLEITLAESHATAACFSPTARVSEPEWASDRLPDEVFVDPRPDDLLSHSPKRRGMMVGMRSALFICLGATLIAQNNTPDRSTAIGRQLVEEVHRSTTLVEQPAVQEYVAKLGARLDADDTFSVIKGSRTKGLLEPIAISGRYIFVAVGLLLAANDEAEFSGMVAQAIVRARKPIKPIWFQQNPWNHSSCCVVNSFDGVGVWMSADAFAQRRADELEADAIAVPLMSGAGFDPAALLRYIERRQPVDRPDTPFPVRADRIAGLQQAIRDLPPATYSESDKFYAIQEQVRPLPVSPPQSDSRPTLFRKPEPPK
jgi:hypothetical protein